MAYLEPILTVDLPNRTDSKRMYAQRTYFFNLMISKYSVLFFHDTVQYFMFVEFNDELFHMFHWNRIYCLWIFTECHARIFSRYLLKNTFKSKVQLLYFQCDILKAGFHCSRFARAGGAGFENLRAKRTLMENGLKNQTWTNGFIATIKKVASAKSLNDSQLIPL
jgi:hypothetical protein